MTGIEETEAYRRGTVRAVVERSKGEDTIGLALTRVLAFIYDDARTEALNRLERAYVTLAAGGRLDLVVGDLDAAVYLLTANVDRRITTAERVLSAPIRQVV